MTAKFQTLLVAVCALSTLPAFGQATRTWVSGVGDDANPCSRTAPCKTFAGAISKTAAGGEIDALDPAGFGSVTVNKALTIDGGEGQVGSVLVGGTVGIAINAGSTDVVTLRNLSINGLGSTSVAGTTGLNVTSAGTVHLEHVKIFGFNTAGITVSSTSTALSVVNCEIDDITGPGVNVAGSGDSAQLENVHIFNTTTGISAGDSTQVNARNVDIATATNGAVATSASGSTVLALDTVLITGTTTAVQANGANATATANNSTFNNNGTVFGAGGGTIGSFGNNRVKPGNGAIGTITTTYALR